MRPGDSGSRLKPNPVKELGLIVLSAVLFSLSFPNLLNIWGFSPLAYLCLYPLFVLINRTTWPRLFLYGPICGFLSYTLFNYWLAVYHPLALLIVPTIYAVWYLILFLLLKMARSLVPGFGYLVQVLVWIAWEYLRIQGFLGYAYGNLGYTQYLFLPLGNFAALTGVWGVCAIVIFPAIYAAWLRGEGPAIGNPPGLLGYFRQMVQSAGNSLRSKWPVWTAYAAVFIFACVVGLVEMRDYSRAPTVRLALVQQDIDPWVGGTKAYAESLTRLIRQSDQALSEDPGIKMLVWSETSFIPAIEYHYKYRDDAERFDLVKQLKDYIASKKVPYLLGNGDAVAYIDEAGNRARKDYNAVLLYDGYDLKADYRKLRLVPFTETFPYRKELPGIYQLLVDNDTSFWEAGSDYVVMNAAGFSFGTPICFEDTFGYLSRDFINRGAQVIINLTNDSWSKSVPAAMQHMAMATFRAMENRRTVVRSTNGGMSVLIDPNGKILKMNEPFTESHMIVDAPVYDAMRTPYLKWGDWFAQLCVILASLSLLLGIVFRLFRLRSPRKS